MDSNAFSISELLDLSELARISPDLTFVEGPPVGFIDYLEDRPNWKESSGGWPLDDLLGSHSRIGYRHRLPILVAGEKLSDAKAQVRALFKSLPLHGALKESLRRAAESAAGRPIVVVHCRRGDIVAGLRSAGEMSVRSGSVHPLIYSFARFYFRKSGPIQALFAKLPEYLGAKARIVILGDHQEDDLNLAGFASDQILALDQFKEGLTPNQQAMFDIVFMSKASRIIGSHSTFGEFPAFIGGVRIEYIDRICSIEEFLHEVFELIGLDREDFSDELRQDMAAAVHQAMIEVKMDRVWKFDRDMVGQSLERSRTLM